MMGVIQGLFVDNEGKRDEIIVRREIRGVIRDSNFVKKN